MSDSDGQPSPEVVVDGKEPPVGAYLPFEWTTISAGDVARMPVKAPGPVTLQDRQGVFVHSFKCSICDLEFVVFSWRANRHRVGTTLCPECCGSAHSPQHEVWEWAGRSQEGASPAGRSGVSR